MVVQNRTMELTLSAEPRNLDIHPKEDDPRILELTWQPPKVQNGRITGMIIILTIFVEFRIFCYFRIYYIVH